jgi:HEAT repeat protein
MRFLIPALVLAVPACAQKLPEVDRAFEATRAGKGAGFESVLKMGDAAIPAVARYLRDRDESMRSQAVAVLSAMASPAACEAMVPGLSDASPDLRDRTARALYKNCRKNPPASAAAPLRTLVKQGTVEASAILLLRAFPGEETKAALQAVAKQRKPVRLLEDGQPVLGSLAAAVAGGEALGPLTKTESLAERLFVLSAVEWVRDPADLKALASYLDDKRDVRNTGVPSGVGPKRRLCDVALEALAKRAGWKPPFEVDGIRRYTDAELNQAKAKTQSTLSP